MYRNFKRIVITIFTLSLVNYNSTVYAGNINGNEQEIIAVIDGTFSYNGVKYKSTKAYRDQAIAYLIQDNVDFTKEQAEKAINMIYANVNTGVDAGYIVPIKENQTGMSPKPNNATKDVTSKDDTTRKNNTANKNESGSDIDNPFTEKEMETSAISKKRKPESESFVSKYLIAILFMIALVLSLAAIIIFNVIHKRNRSYK